MVKLISTKKKENINNVTGANGSLIEEADVVVELYADDVSELDSMTECEGLDLTHYTISAGSYCYDSGFNIAVMKSDGAWNVAE